MNNEEKYFHDQESEMFKFYQVPQALVDDPEYESLSAEAILLYAIMLNRMGLSARSENWRDESGRIFIYLKMEEAMRRIHCHEGKAVKIFRELEEACLIERKRQGQGKPSRIYILKFSNRISRSAKNAKKKVRKTQVEPADTLYKSKKEISNTDLSIYQPAQQGDEPANEAPPSAAMDGLTETKKIMAEACKAGARIGGGRKSGAEIADAFQRLTDDDIRETLANIPDRITPSRRRAYLLTALYATAEGKAIQATESESEYSFGNMVRRFHDNLNKSRNPAHDTSIDKYIKDFHEGLKREEAEKKKKISPSFQRMLQEFHEEMTAEERDEE